MLKSLFGCKSVERILFYLLVNEKCYAHQLHRMLHIPLTPIQKALARLEEGKIINSTYEGKTRIYQFNSDYPLLNELEMLLKKAFQQLPPHEKKCYYYQGNASGDRKQQHELLDSIWNHLKNATNVTLVAKSRSKQMERWNRKGNGKVSVKQDGQTIVFNEQGSWRGEQEYAHNYTNSFRWHWNTFEGILSLEHLRFGENNPVFLFHLVPTKVNLLESLTPIYAGRIPILGGCNTAIFFCSSILEQLELRKMKRLSMCILNPTSFPAIAPSYTIFCCTLSLMHNIRVFLWFIRC